MKRLIILIYISSFVSLFAQESAVNFIIPKVNHTKKLYASEVKAMTDDIVSIAVNNFKNKEVKYQPRIETDGTITYKVIYYKSGGQGIIEDYAYFINFSGNKAILKGYSKYTIEKGVFLEKVINEEYTALSASQTYYQVPSESYQTTEWTYNDPISGKSIKASGYYKTMVFNGKDERILIIEHTENGAYTSKVKKEYFLKNFGLIAMQSNQNEMIYLTNLAPFKLYSNTFLESLSEENSRILGWNMIKSIRNEIDLDDLFEESSEDTKINTMDSLVGLYEHLMIKYPAKENVYRYILSLIYSNWVDYHYDGLNSAELKNITTHKNIMENIDNYFFMRLTPDYISKSDLKGFVTNIDESFYEMYYYNLFIKFSALYNFGYSCNYFDYLTSNEVASIEKDESNISSKNLFFLHSYLAIYYACAKDNRKAYYNYVLTLENYKSITSADKDLNIEYMKKLMKDLIEKKPSNETDLIRGVNAALGLNDNLNALKIADNGYSNGIGVSLDFSMLFAKIAFNNDIDKPYLRKAMQLMQDKLSIMSSEQIKNYLIYCKAMAPEFDCSKAEGEVKKIQKREQEEQEKKLKEDKKKARKTSYAGGKRGVNLALAFNPLAGMNTKGQGNFFKFLPVSVELRTGKVIHEFRMNTFFGFDPKNRFIGGKVIENLPSINTGWKNLTGTDYSYGIYFMENKISSYDKKCESQGFGFQFLYGNFTTNIEQINVTINNLKTQVLVKPEITRMEILLNMKGNIYNWKSHLFVTGFWGVGVGTRSILYNSQNTAFTQVDLADDSKSKFEDKRFVQANWKGYYFAVRMGFRIGFTLF
ncbi:MAG: hypothetical protein PSX81_15595 [bacterium]|nr:hypothetical protein [bacterium]